MAKWIGEGEQVAIARSGTLFATLPGFYIQTAQSRLEIARLGPKSRWADKLSAGETEAFWARLRNQGHESRRHL